MAALYRILVDAEVHPPLRGYASYRRQSLPLPHAAPEQRRLPLRSPGPSHEGDEREPRFVLDDEGALRPLQLPHYFGSVLRTQSRSFSRSCSVAIPATSCFEIPKEGSILARDSG